jgi:hypothetical protein
MIDFHSDLCNIDGIVNMRLLLLERLLIISFIEVLFSIVLVLFDKNKLDMVFVVIKDEKGSSEFENNDSNGFKRVVVNRRKCSLSNIPPTIIFSDFPALV